MNNTRTADMNRVFRFVLTTVCILTCVCFMHTQVASAYDLRIGITDEPVKNVTNQMYGMDFTFSSLDPFVNDDLSLNEDVLSQFRGYPLGNSRMMGTASRYYRWKNSIGPYSERDYIGYYSFKKEKVGIVEWIKIVREINPDATFTFTLNLETDTASNAADLAEFLSGDGTVNYNGGVNWAEKRIELGLEEPVPVVWELGNETDQSSYNLIYNFTPKDYVRVAKKYISAIRKVDPDAVFAAHSATNSLSFNDPETQIENRGGWNRHVLTELQDDIDYFVFHSYGTLQQNVLKLEDNLDFAIEDMKATLKEENRNRIKLYFTEYSVRVDGKITDSKYKIGHRINGALVVSEMINRLLLVPEVERANYHIFMNPHTRGAFYQTDPEGAYGGAYRPSAMGEIMRLYADHGVGTVVESDLNFYLYTWSNYYKNHTEQGVTSVVVKNGNRYNVFVCNQEHSDHSLSFTLPDGTYKLVSHKVVSGPTEISSRWYSSTYPDIAETDEIDVVYTTPDTEVESESTAFNIPKYSLSVFELENIDG